VAPHLRLQLDDLFFALGYTHAQERLWADGVQSTTGRRHTIGDASEVTLDIDVFMRT